jgi:hypothetical protein
MLDHMSRFLAYDSAIDAEEIVLRHAVSDLQPHKDLVRNFLGVLMEPSLYPPLLDNLVGKVEQPPIPANWHADVPEWAAVLRAIELSGPEFSILELGSAWGCWMCNAGMAAKRSGRSVRLMGVEAVQEFVDLAKKHLEYNEFSQNEYTLYLGIAAAKSGHVFFPKKEAGAINFGLSPVYDPDKDLYERLLNSGTHDLIKMHPLSEILSDVPRLDLLHIDIQGGEVVFLEENMPEIARKVAYVFVGTHSREIEGKIFENMLSNGFFLEIERPAMLTLNLKGNPVTRYDGVQAWRNSRF